MIQGSYSISEMAESREVRLKNVSNSSCSHIPRSKCVSVETLKVPEAAPSKRRGPAERLRNKLIEMAGGHGEVVHHSEKAWASITFSGSRHSVRMVFDGADAVEAAETLIARLPDHEFSIAGQLVADANVTSVEHTLIPAPRMLVECELLLLLDG